MSLADPQTNTSDNRPADNTLKTLRTKKLRGPMSSDRLEKLSLLRLAIHDLVAEARLLNRVDKFRTRLGTICIRPVTENVDKELLRPFSTKEIREIVAEAVK